MPHPVRRRDRVLNVLAMLCIMAGAAIFLLARRTLSHVATGGLALPDGQSYVAYTDSVVLRTRVGLWLVAVGAILAVTAAISHRFRRNA